MTIYEDSVFVIKRSKDIILIRKHFPYQYHSHFKSVGGAKIVMNCFRQRLIPVNGYFKIALKRITTDEEWDRFTYKRKKKSYRNDRPGRKV